jgi:hypothetical protein
LGTAARFTRRHRAALRGFLGLSDEERGMSLTVVNR